MKEYGPKGIFYSPEHIMGNLWKMLPGEFIETSDGKKLEGPLIVRVTEFPEENRLSIQASDHFEVEGSSFEAVVQKIPDIPAHTQS